jgi:hypothetical protein
MKISQFISRMNRREWLLSLLVGLVVFALVNLFLWSWLLGKGRAMRAEVAKRKLARQEQTVYLRESDLWAKRGQWLKEHQPAYRGPGDASTLLEQVKQVGGKHNIVIENPAIGTGDVTSAYQSIFASVDTKSPWGSLVHFLYDVQQPESFIVFETITLAVDPGDATQMRGKFRVARWAAPAGGGKPK